MGEQICWRYKVYWIICSFQWCRGGVQYSISSHSVIKKVIFMKEIHRFETLRWKERCQWDGSERFFKYLTHLLPSKVYSFDQLTLGCNTSSAITRKRVPYFSTNFKKKKKNIDNFSISSSSIISRVHLILEIQWQILEVDREIISENNNQLFNCKLYEMVPCICASPSVKDNPVVDLHNNAMT